MSSTTTHDHDGSRSNNTSPADEVLREARIAELGVAIEEADEPLTSKQAGERTDVPVGTAKKMLRREDAFFVAYAERIRGASYRHYWGVRSEEVDDTFVRPAENFHDF